MALETTGLHTADIVTLVIYFVIVLAVGLVVTYKINRGSVTTFFLAGKSMTWIPIAGSLFATNMGAPLLVGLTGSGAATGFAPVMFEWHATYMLILLGWIFVPIYISSSTITMPQYLKKRYGGKRLQIYYACNQIFLTILLGISTEILAASIFINQILGWNVYVSTVLILIVTALYTIVGGLAAVMWTDALQSVIIIIGTLVLSILALEKIGGYESMVHQFPQAISKDTLLIQSLYGNRSCGIPPDDFEHIFRGMDSAYPWPALTIGLTIHAAAFFCTSQVMVQRTLAAKSVTHSKAACILTSYLKMLPFILFLIPGMISRILYPDEVACSDPDSCFEICENRNGCSDVAFPLLVLRLLPPGLRGLMLAALLAAVMSSLTSQFNSGSSVFTIDIWRHLRPRASEREVIIVGRICSALLVLISLAWLPILMELRGSRLWDYLQSIGSYVTPPWIVIFTTGVFWTRATEQGAWWGVMAGLVTGICRMAIHFSYSTPKCGSNDVDTRPAVLTKVHYLHFAIILAGVTFIVQVFVSFVTYPRSPQQLRRVTWWTRFNEADPELTDDENGDSSQHDSTPSENNSLLEKCCNKVCGFYTPINTANSRETNPTLPNIIEDKLWSRICNINAVVVIALVTFIIAFYA